jgi:hypothetical protein
MTQLREGSRWEHFNATTGETREYELLTDGDGRATALCRFQRVGGEGVAQVYRPTLLRPVQPGKSYWRAKE